MTQKQKEQLEKFKKFTSWMCGDISRTMFCAKANFLVAQGLVNYTETLGSFLRPYKTSKKGKIVRTTTGERFLAFFVRLGAEYQKLLRKYWGKNSKKVYDDLRNGLTHEYLIKRKYFTVYGVDKFMSDGDLDHLTIKIDGRPTHCPCGIIHQRTKNRKGYWHFVNGKYFVDFKRAVENYIKEIESEKFPNLNRHFLIRANEVNLKHFN